MSRPVALLQALPLTARCGVLSLMLLSGGCAAKPAVAPQAGMTAPVIAVARAEIEEDGLPVQVAPRLRRAGQDDPSQPWSPNYGGPREQALVVPSDERRVRYATEAEALAAARSRLADMATPAAAAYAPDRPQAAPTDDRRVRYATEAEALAAARRRLASTAEQPATRATAKPLAGPVVSPGTRLSGVDEDALVRRAIAEHEMRRRDY